jgi:hypothetical protein
MAITVTTVVKPAIACAGIKMAIYSLALDNSWLAAGEAIDLTADFDYIYAASVQQADAIADLAYKFDVVCDYAAAVTSSNVLVSAYVTSTDTAVADYDLAGLLMDDDSLGSNPLTGRTIKEFLNGK